MHIGIIGGGIMGDALISGVVTNNLTTAQNIAVSEPVAAPPMPRLS